METAQAHEYDLLAGESCILQRCIARSVFYVVTWDGLAARCHRKRAREVGFFTEMHTYCSKRVSQRMLEARPFEVQRGIEITVRS